jgi:CubicO group peptidase (beta-lactamase class C family)
VHGVAAHASFDERAARAAVWRAYPRLSRPPGTRYAYSNIGYWILGALVEQVTGAPLSAHVASRIREPLGLAPADLGYTVLDPTRLAGGYLERWSWMHLLAPLLVEPALLGPRQGAWRRIEAHYPNGAGFGGLVGTARAFARLLQDQLRPASVLLREETRALLYRQQQTGSGQLVPMTLGWHVGAVDGAPCYFKEGGGGGFHALMRLCPARGTGAVLMCNATRFDVTTCLDTVEALLHAS